MIKFFKSPIFGMCVADTTNNKMYLFNNDRTKYQVIENSEMEEIYQYYKNVNVIKKPYCVLVYGQVFKNRNYGIKPFKNLTKSELEELLSNKEKVEYYG